MDVKKPVAYMGREPYVFVSYAHDDKARVYPIIQKLQDRGLRVWYDDALEGGDDWREKVALALDGSTQVIGFISKNFVQSRDCKDEINMARSEGKGPILTSLEEVSFPADMRLSFSSMNIIKRSNYSSVDEFVDKIALSEALRPCFYDLSRRPVRNQSNPAPVKSAPVKSPPVKAVPARKKSASGKGKIIGIAAAAVAVLALVLVLVIPRLGGNTDPTGTDPNATGGSGGTVAPLPNDPKDRYDLAMDYIRQEKYDDAYGILKELGDYSDSASQMKAIREKAFLQQIGKANPGDIVYWGSYEQDAVTANGKEDIAWVVLYDDNGRKLLLSQSCLDSQPYNEQNTPTSWAKCSLRTWLNDDFYWEAFNDAEQEALHLNATKTDGSDDTRDYVLLLSMAEANLYLDLFENGLFTEYAVHQGAVHDLQHWWLRDTHNGAYNFAATCYGDQKKVSDLGEQVYRSGIGVRPAIWVDTRTEAQLEAAYNEAINLFENANYKKALPAFEALGDYKDSQAYCKRLPKLILMKPYMDAEVGDEVRLGNYDWIVVEKQEGKILVVSMYSVHKDGFRDHGTEITWDISDAREYLNGTFLNQKLQAGDEKSLILPTLVSTPANPQYGTEGGPDVTDLVFLLSYEEVMRYFPNAQDRVLTTEEDKTTTVTWWTRTMGDKMSAAVCVDNYGNIIVEGLDTSDFVSNYHFRPAIWISTAE